jgi:hypothetical protein
LLTSTTMRFFTELSEMPHSISNCLASGREALAEFIQVEGQRVGLDLHAHVEAVVQRIAVLRGLRDQAAVAGDEAAHGRHDARAVRAGQREDVAAWRRFAHRCPFVLRAAVRACVRRPDAALMQQLAR